MPATLLADLYKYNLADIPESSNQKKAPAEKKSKAAEPALKWLGKNKKGIVVLVDYENEVHLPDAQLNFLSNILQACKLNLEDVAILNINRQRPDFENANQELSFRQAILFGVDPSIASLPSFANFSIQEIGGKQWLTAPAIEVLNDNSATGKQQKGALWTALKQLFGI